MMHLSPAARSLLLATILTCCLFQCGRGDGVRPLPPELTTYDYPEKQGREMPYEVWSENGEAYLTDVYYAENAQNDQVIPTALLLQAADGRSQVAYQIDRLIYPTLGNPNLFVKNDSDELMIVLRLETETLEGLGLRTTGPIKNKPHLSLVEFEKSTGADEIRFYLIDRDARALTETSGAIAPGPARAAFRIFPEEIVAHDMAEVPRVFAGRRTVRFLFRGGGVPVRPGLYDLRFELVRGGNIAAREFQYNAVRVFEPGADAGRYFVLNMTDNQLSVSNIGDALKPSFRRITLDKLNKFVAYLNDPGANALVRRAAFLTFNGDLHNGGSPATLLPRDVALTYLQETRASLETLRELPLPVFLIPGNHDGYVSTGHVPGSIARLQARDSLLHTLFGWFLSSLKDPVELDELVAETVSPAVWDKLDAYLDETDDVPGGWHLDLFGGRFIRRARAKNDDGSRGVYWKEVPDEIRNMILYDGFYQWRRSYGPLNASWNFGRNHFVNINSFDLRQHRRTGWGMYTVNYGGGVSDFQMHWLRRDVIANRERDVVLLAHHDPRGGHKGVNYPYYFKQIDYYDMGDSALNYLRGEVINPVLCKTSLSELTSMEVSCLTDGLQEWMRADQEFDCRSWYLFESGDRSGMCDRKRMKAEGKSSVYSGYQLIHQLASKQQIRTLLLGHTHYNSLEVFVPGEELIPETVTLGPDIQKRLAHLEKVAPARRESMTMNLDAIMEENNIFRLDLKAAGHNFKRTLSGHELAVLRMTTTAELTEQRTRDDRNFMDGFTLFEVFPENDSRGYRLPQINRVYYFQAQPDGDDAAPRFRLVTQTKLDRTRSLRRDAANNPVQREFILPE